MIEARVLVTGFVQGVGYRQFVKKKARELRLTGWVRNLPDGHVEAVFQGSKEQIENMIDLCKKGPMLSEIKDVVVTWVTAKDKFSSFETQSTPETI